MSRAPVSGFMKDIAKHTMIFGSSNVLRQGLGLILLPVYLTLIPPAEYGVLSMLMIASNLISLLTSSTLAPALFRSYYDYNDRAGQRMVVTTALVFTFTIAFVFIALSIPFTGKISLLLTGSESHWKLAMFILVSAGATALNTICLTVYRVKKWSKRYAVLSLVTMLVSMLTIIYLVVIRKMGIEGIVTGNLVGAVIGTLLSLFFIRAEIGGKISITEVKKMYLFGYPHIPENFTAFALNSGTRLILRTLCGSEGVGIYALGYRIGSVLEKLIINPLNMIAPASIMSVEQETNPQRYYSVLAKYYFIVTGFAAMFLSLMTRPFLTIFSRQGYFEAWKVVPFIAMAIAAYGGRGLVSVGLMLKRKTIWYPIAYLLGAMIALGLMVFLTDWYGPPGAAISLLVGNLTVCYIRNRASNKFLHVKIPFGKIVRGYLVYLCFGIPGSLFTWGNPIADVAFLAVLSLTIVPFFLVKVGALNYDELSGLKSIIASRIKALFAIIGQVCTEAKKKDDS